MEKTQTSSIMVLSSNPKKNTNKWYAYFEWGRTGSQNPDCQFVECSSKEEAAEEYAKQLHSKNDKRGEWATIAGIKTLRAKPGKDCYLVRPQATRSTGLPDGRTIKSNEGVKAAPTAAQKKVTKAASAKVDPQTLSLMKDLNVATLQYSKGQMASGSLPTQVAIDEARQILTEAQKRLLKTGDDLDTQIKDPELNDLTKVLYGRIPKIKAVKADPSTWVLSKDNILAWNMDLDAFESALSSGTIEQAESDPFDGMDIDMSWIDPESSIGKWAYNRAAKSTRNVHGYLGHMKIRNIWKVLRRGDDKILYAHQDDLLKEKRSWNGEKALFQGDRPDVGDKQKAYYETNTFLLFHGTRSVNTSGILRKGLMLPRQLVGVQITGAMFGPGLYYADDWKKSAGYCSLSGGVWSRGDGGVRNRQAFMFMADVVCGNPYVAPGPSGYVKPPQGHHCVFGKAGKSQVMNNEWIVYTTRQNCLRYLIEFSA